MRKRTPQEKKELSYTRDRRNTFGEAPHAARKSIPLRKALRSRANRRAGNQILQTGDSVIDAETAEMIESQLRHRPLNDWGKWPDEPLGKVLKKKLEERAVMREGGGRSGLKLSVPFNPLEQKETS